MKCNLCGKDYAGYLGACPHCIKPAPMGSDAKMKLDTKADAGFGRSHQDCLIKLGKALKSMRAQGEQFCVFAFDMMEHKVLTPVPAGITKDMLPLGPDIYPNANWTAAFWSVTRPHHTEVAILDGPFDHWLANYASIYGAPSELYIFSALIPCFRDGNNGMCSERIQTMIRHVNKTMKVKLNLRVGWSNDDVDVEAAHATRHGMADLEDDDIGISLHTPSTGMSISGPPVNHKGY